MAHNCIDWTVTPPARKTPLLVLTRGDDHVYTAVPEEFKTLEQVARREFGLGDQEIRFSSACLNLCNGRPARITESAWAHISPFIGCATVEVSGQRDEEHQLSQGSLKRKLPPEADEENEGEHAGSDHESAVKQNDTVKTTDELDVPSDHANDPKGDDASAPANHREESGEMQLSVPSPRKARIRRRLASETEDEGGETSEREHPPPTGSQTSPIASPLKLSQSDLGKETEKERHESPSPPSTARPEASQEPSKAIKQEKSESRTASSRPTSQYESSQLTHTGSQVEVATQSQAQVESSETQKLMIRVAHRPSKQEAKFTTKNTTKVAKVLSGVCKSFGLDVNLATLYLIVSTEDDAGEENLFPCDTSDTISRAGAERNVESKFLLKMVGEA